MSQGNEISLPATDNEQRKVRPYAVGIDVGGTKIAAGVLDRSMNLLSVYVTKEHSGRLPAQVIDSIENTYLEVLNRAHISPDEVVGIGMSFAGHTDGKRGVVLTSSNMPEWNQVHLRDILSKRLNQHVLVDNDTNLAVVAEHRYGAGQDASNLVYVTCSTGIGMGIMIDGKLYQGHTGTAGEVGHTVVEVDGRLCTCGKRGCLMAYAGGIALCHRAQERIAMGEETLLRDLSWNDPQLINGELILEAARQGDPLAQDLIISTGRYLGIGLSDVVEVLNPELIILGGGLTSIGSMLLDPCLEALRENLPSVLWGSARVVLGRYQQNVSLIGGAAAIFTELDVAELHSSSDYSPVALDRTAPRHIASPLSNEERLVLEQVQGTTFNLQRSFLEDGPSFGTAVFLKGCPLRCTWCASPESQRVKPELLKLETAVWAGQQGAAGELLSHVLNDGATSARCTTLTLTGGEPLLQPSFAEALLRLAKDEQLVTEIETTGNAPWEVLETIFPYVDMWIYELKHVDSAAHHEWTGLCNELILSNLRKLVELGAPIRVRVPLIPGFNADDESLRSIGQFLAQLDGSILSFDLVPIETPDRKKYEALGSADKFCDVLYTTEGELQSAAEFLKSFKLNVRITGNRPCIEVSRETANGLHAAAPVH